ncbi:recombinase family protein [Nocardioides campestrisoli]|uniref:recombinase family protein n=1 Tax=Nocardioides campestrisoli TaxID=2736757 RepID=UPI00163D8DC5|nr:recombinase family protein [Nocardioides campestrisoli]
MGQQAEASTGILIGYARCSTEDQDLEAQRQALERLGVVQDRIYLDHGRTGKNRDRIGLREAMAACREGDTLVVTKLDRLARSVRDASDIAEELAERGVALSLGGAVHDPTDPMGRLLFNILSMIAEFERDLISARTREGMEIARQKGRLRGRQPKLSVAQERHVVSLMADGGHTAGEVADLFGVARSSVYRIVARAAETDPVAST